MKIKSLHLTPLNDLKNENSLAYENLNKLKLFRNKHVEKFVITPELIKLKQVEDQIFLFSPLLLKIHSISKDKYENLISNKFKDDIKEFINNDLVIPENLDFFPKDDKFFVRVSLTGNCNLKCIYCIFKGGESKKNIDPEFVKAALDYLIKNYPERKILIFFSGGEPTMQVENIKDIYNYVKSTMKKDMYSFAITTNGMFSEKTITWVLENIDSIAISFDGLPEIQDTTRPMKNGKSSTKIVEENINKLLEYGKSPKISSVITKYNVRKQTEIVNYLNRMGIDKIVFLSVKPFGRSINKNLGFTREIFIKNFLMAKEMAEDYGILLKTNSLNMTFPLKNSCKLGSSFELTENGEVLGCQFLKDYFSSIKSSLDLHSIGHYDRKRKKLIITNEKNIQILSDRNVLTIPECRQCFAKWSCGSGCPLKSFREFNDLYRPSKDCYAIKMLLRKYLMFKIGKHFIRIKPYIEKKDNKLYFSMFFNKLKLNVSKNHQNIKTSSLIRIDNSGNLEKIYRHIVNETNKMSPKTTLFLLSFNMNFNDYEKRLPAIIKFLRKLKSNRIHFKVTKPLPKCLLASKYSTISEEFSIPKSCSECLELFIVESGKIKLCNGKEGKLENFLDRNEIYKFKQDNINDSDKRCKFCKYNIRKQCNALCSHGIMDHI